MLLDVPVSTDSAVRKAQFLEAIKESGNVSAVTAAMGLDRSTPYKWRARDTDFATKWDEALEIGREVLADELEAEMHRRALEKSDVLLIFALKSLRPNVYRERIANEYSGPNGGPIVLSNSGSDTRELTREELSALAKRAIAQLKEDSGARGQNDG